MNAILLLAALVGLAAAEDFGRADLSAMKKSSGGMPSVAGAAQPEPASASASASGGCVYDGKDRVGTLHMVFEFLRAQAGWRPESDWLPVLYYVGEKPAEKAMLEDYGLSKAIAMSYDPMVDINDSGNHAVMMTPHVFDVACKGNEVGWVAAHELAHHKKGHMEALKQLKLKLWPAWRDRNGSRFAGVCAGLAGKDMERCFRQKIFSVYIEETPEIVETAKAQEREADALGNEWMTKLNPSYTKESAKAVLDRIKQYEKRENIAPSKFYDSAEVRALNIDKSGPR